MKDKQDIPKNLDFDWIRNWALAITMNKFSISFAFLTLSLCELCNEVATTVYYWKCRPKYKD